MVLREGLRAAAAPDRPQEPSRAAAGGARATGAAGHGPADSCPGPAASAEGPGDRRPALAGPSGAQPPPGPAAAAARPALAGVGGRAPRRAPSPAGPAPKRRRPSGSSSSAQGGSGGRLPALPFSSAAAVRVAAATPASAMAANCERTFIAIKPDGVQRGLVGDIIKRFEQKGFRLVAMKFLHASEDLLKQHYIDLKDRPFYPGLVKYMNSGPVVAMVWEGLNVVKTGRVMLGETNPADSKPGTIRGDFCIQVGRNIIHGSDSVESAQKEINLWFKPAELVDYKSCAHDWIYE
ncbi:nucleoside diphosphate kinase [Dryobates pubescens]|uniref:nucleoside diphosphate kinase n=1 Tax=Dryobates pubescens TaxID=118200 RepID=UPI0023BA0177|nr:nucleoside diphosphate kinase [Dryobates pubescens]